MALHHCVDVEVDAVDAGVVSRQRTACALWARSAFRLLVAQGGQERAGWAVAEPRVRDLRVRGASEQPLDALNDTALV